MQASTAKAIVAPADTSTLNTQPKITRRVLGQHGPGFKPSKSAKSAKAVPPPNAPSLCPQKLLTAMDSTNKDVAAEARAALEFYKFGQRFEILSVPVRAEGPRVYVKPDSPVVDDKDVSVYLDTAEDLAALDSYKFGPRTFADPRHQSTQPLFVREHRKGSPLCAFVQDYSNRSLVFCEATAEVINGNPYAYDRIESRKRVKGRLINGESIRSICKEPNYKKPQEPNPTQKALNDAYAASESKPKGVEFEEFFRQLFRYVRRKAKTGFGNDTLIESDIVEDVTADFVMHIKEKLEAGKFRKDSPFCNWVNVCWMNFKNGELTKEGNRIQMFVQLEETEDEVEHGDKYQIGMQDLDTALQYLRDLNINKVSILEGLEVDETALAVAGCLGEGLNQKETANELGISPYLVREAKKDLEKALQPKTAVISKPAADSCPLPGTVGDLCASGREAA